MRGIIPLNVHNVIDYVAGAILMLCPALFGFSDLYAARNTFVVLGGSLIAYSLFTDYRYSLVKLIPIGVHMTFDVAAGVILMLAPWIFGYHFALTGFQVALHFILGLGVIALVALTRPKAQADDMVDRETPSIGRAA